jgi:agmatine deiminase
MTTPFTDGYHFPAEWEPHEATWLSYPHSDDSFPGKLESVYPSYMRFIAEIAKSEKVRINVPASFKERLISQLDAADVNAGQVEIFERDSNDVWCRDHGPAFVVRDVPMRQKAVVDWEFNAWGGKYPHDADNLIAGAIAADFGLPVYRPGIVMEGGSVEFNGKGTLLTTKACLLHPNRNPHLNQQQIEKYLHDYYGVHQILWLGDGIAGDDTDGHVDDVTRFANAHTIITAIETDRNDVNYAPLQENLRTLQQIRLLNSSQPDIVELPMPAPVFHNGQRLPASYANFYITNEAVIAPTFRCAQDDRALQILAACFPDRRITGIDSTDIVWGFGSFHCLSQQEPV